MLCILYNHGMQLNDFLKLNTIRIKDFAASVMLAATTVYKYVDGTRKPTKKEILQRIYAATSGQVTANDFYELPTKPKRHGSQP